MHLADYEDSICGDAKHVDTDVFRSDESIFMVLNFKYDKATTDGFREHWYLERRSADHKSVDSWMRVSPAIAYGAVEYENLEKVVV